jgi:hypothetical protein
MAATHINFYIWGSSIKQVFLINYFLNRLQSCTGPPINVIRDTSTISSSTVSSMLA